ncbi:hypothetical protein DP939_26815 [Spongiactinospora rosea]|uniref:Glycosyltransferase RgtA/B/C/D-like domain-containing protein n=1 Tax=Spongiactinospora rosea TaxID=2248750 RepID=A0A366LU49_9ACTN|nr:hypothetical protein DP939_26815 [Spongiactinospora rosea]
MLAVGSAAPALALAGWLTAALPLLLAGRFTPVFALLTGVPLAVLACWAGVRRASAPIEARPWHVVAVFAVAIGSGVFNALLHAEQLIVRRDPATYALSAAWVAEHGSLPIPYQDAAFGGTDPALIFESVGFFDHQGAVVPQFVAGPSLIYAIGHWAGGVTGLLLTPAVLGSLAVLTVAGAAARLIGGRWAPLAALAFAVSLPILYTSRTTFSEIPSLIMIFGGVILFLDATSGGSGSGRRVVAGLAGAVFGLATLVRIDGLRDILPVLAFAGLLVARSRARREGPGGLGVWLLGGLVLGAGAGFTAAWRLSWPYLEYLRGSLVPLLLICAAVLVLTVLGAALAPRLAALRLPSRLPGVVAALVVTVTLILAARPLFQTVRRVPDNDYDRRTADFIEAIQRGNGLPPDPHRLYYEHSLTWVTWYVGLPVVLLATLAAAILARRLTNLTTTPHPGLLPAAPGSDRPARPSGAGRTIGAAKTDGPTRATVPLTKADNATAQAGETDQSSGAEPGTSGAAGPGKRAGSAGGADGPGQAAPIAGGAEADQAGGAIRADRAVREAGRGGGFGWAVALAIIGWTTFSTLLLPSITPDHPFASRRLVPVVVPGMVLLGVWGLRWVLAKARERGYGLRARRGLAVAGVVLVLVPPAFVSGGTAFTPVERGEAAAVSGLCAAIPPDASVLLVERVTGDRFAQVVRGLCGVPAARVRILSTIHKEVAQPADVKRLMTRIRQAGRRPVLLAAAQSQLTPYAPAPRHTFHLRSRQDERSLTSPPDATWSLSIDVWMAIPG